MLKYFRKVASILHWWIDFTLDHSRLLLLLVLLLSVGILHYTINNFKINTDLTEMVSDELPFRKIYKEYREKFPLLDDLLLVVVEADTPELAIQSRKALANRLLEEGDIFKTVYLPGGETFFEKNGLLYLNTDELEELTDNLASVQPFLGLLSQDLSLKNFFSILDEFVTQSADEISDNERMLLLFDRLSDALDNTLSGKPYHLSWQEIMLGKTVEKSQLRQFIIVKPYIDYSSLAPGAKAIDTIRSIAHELNFNEKNGVTVRLTGNVAFQIDDLISVSRGIGLAALISFVFVTVILYIGLRSGRLVIISLLTLVLGIVWTMGFAIAFIGSLNMISIAFVVLFIGLGVDYSIQFCLRYTEFLSGGIKYRRQAIRNTAEEVGDALLLCTITTAIGFYAFVPTDYIGASELGIISGTGMFIILFANLTVLPALLNLIPAKGITIEASVISETTSAFINKFPRAIIFITLILAVGAALLLPKVAFDFNPLNLSNQADESVLTAKGLFEDSKTSPWPLTLISENLEQAAELAASLEKLPEVESTITIADFVPGNQAEKLDMIADIALFMPENLQNTYIPPLDLPKTLKASENFAKTLKDVLLTNPNANDTFVPTVKRLYDNLQRLVSRARPQQEILSALTLLEKASTGTLSIMLHDLDTLLQEPYEFGLSDLPKGLQEYYVSPDGDYLVQIFPSENISDFDALKRFVSAVHMIAPDASSAPVTIIESGKAVISAFRNALIFALTLIVIFLFLILKMRREIVLILTPLLLAMLFTISTTVLIKIPFNFANVIVLPLLLGIGIDYGIHLIYRYRSSSLANDELLQTSTARAVFFSALTTILSFSSLLFSYHKGTASIGVLLSICNGFMILCMLIILPAILKLFSGRTVKNHVT